LQRPILADSAAAGHGHVEGIVGAAHGDGGAASKEEHITLLIFNGYLYH